MEKKKKKNVDQNQALMHLDVCVPETYEGI